MDSSRIQQGFRILLHVLCDDETQIKCYIYVDFNKMKIIKDIEDHIKSILDIYPISIFVDDIWLPSSETVHLIKENDMLFAKKTAVGKIISGSSSPADAVNDGPVKKKRKPSSEILNAITENPIMSSLDFLRKELQNKRTALVQKNEKIKSTTLNKDLQNEDDGIFCLAGKDQRKRIRKHKKKSVIKIAPPRPEIISSSNETVSKSYQGKHKRFPDVVDVDSSIDLVPVKPAESSKITDNESENKASLCQKYKITEEPHSIFIVPEVKELLLSNSLPEFKSMNIVNSSADSKMEVTTENESKEDRDENAPTTQNNSINENRAVNEEDWKAKLLSLATINEKESKIFHRKPVQDVTPNAKTT